MLSISDVINMSKNMSDFKENSRFFTKENTETIEKLTIGQWLFEHRKCFITASKAREVVTEMNKAEKGGGDTINIWTLNQKISGLVLVKPDIPALKYGRDMEIEAANTFIEFIKRKHKDIKLSDSGLFVDERLLYVTANPDRISLCSCCEKACGKMKYLYSVNYTKLCYCIQEY